jgi:hypothetical protein
MRPRDILNRRKKIYFIIVAISFATLAIIAFLDKEIPQELYNMVSLGAGTVFLVGVLLVYFGIKCPKCNATLGLKYVYAEETLHNCPRCGINFDEDSL